MKKKINLLSIFFVESKNQIIMLSVKKYNNRVTIFDKETYKKLSDKRVNRFIIEYYQNNQLYTQMPYSKLKRHKAKLNLPTPQMKLFNQLELQL